MPARSKLLKRMPSLVSSRVRITWHRPSRPLVYRCWGTMNRLMARASSSDPNSAAPTRGQRLCTSLSNIIGDTTLSRLSFPSIPQGTACPPDRHRPHINRAYSIGIIRFSPEKSRLFRGKCKFFYRLYRRLRYSFQVLRDRVRETVALLMPSSWAMRVTDMFRE